MGRVRDHGGGLDAAIEAYGGSRENWIDLSTGINPVAYPDIHVSQTAFASLPDQRAMDDLLSAARAHWSVPEGSEIVAAGGASALISVMPRLAQRGRVHIEEPTYNEHRAAFENHGWEIGDVTSQNAKIIVNPNNPTGKTFTMADIDSSTLTIVDESFCDVAPGRALIDATRDSNVIVLKSFGKFWGLAGLRLGFAIGAREHIHRISEYLGPWAVSGPALEIGTRALLDTGWSASTRTRLAKDAKRLDRLITSRTAEVVGGTHLFRLYKVDDAEVWQKTLARSHIWTRIFPYSDHWLRLGLPAPDQWARLEAAL